MEERYITKLTQYTLVQYSPVSGYIPDHNSLLLFPVDISCPSRLGDSVEVKLTERWVDFAGCVVSKVTLLAE